MTNTLWTVWQTVCRMFVCCLLILLLTGWLGSGRPCVREHRHCPPCLMVIEIQPHVYNITSLKGHEAGDISQTNSSSKCRSGQSFDPCINGTICLHVLVILRDEVGESQWLTVCADHSSDYHLPCKMGSKVVDKPAMIDIRDCASNMSINLTDILHNLCSKAVEIQSLYITNATCTRAEVIGNICHMLSNVTALTVARTRREAAVDPATELLQSRPHHINLEGDDQLLSTRSDYKDQITTDVTNDSLTSASVNSDMEQTYPGDNGTTSDTLTTGTSLMVSSDDVKQNSMSSEKISLEAQPLVVVQVFYDTSALSGAMIAFIVLLIVILLVTILLHWYQK